jgi:hypothetical protein
MPVPCTGAAARWLAAAVVLLMLAAYARFYLTAPPGVTILQTAAARCTPALLAERRPLVIEDRAVRHEELLRTVFRFQYVRATPRQRLPPGAPPRSARARFTLLFDDTTDADVDLLHPSGSDGIVRIALRRGQTLVLPPLWTYAAPAGVVRLRLYDTFHAVTAWATEQGDS